MEQGYLMVVFLMMIGLFPAVVWLFINRKGIDQNPGILMIKTTLFFACYNYFFVRLSNGVWEIQRRHWRRAL